MKREHTPSYLLNHFNGSQYRVTPTDENGIPMKWWRKKRVRGQAEVVEVLEITANGKHVWCLTDQGRRIRKPIGSVSQSIMHEFLIGLIDSEEPFEP